MEARHVKRTSFAALLARNLQLARAVALGPLLDPAQPRLEFLDKGPGACPVKDDHDERLEKRGSGRQEVG